MSREQAEWAIGKAEEIEAHVPAIVNVSGE